MRFQQSTIVRVLAVGFSFVIITLALQAGPAPAPDGSDLYKKRCSMCHGVDGKGYAALKTPDFTDPKFQASMTDQEIADVIKNGKKDTPMPAFADKLSDDEINSLVAYIRSLDSSKKK
jgi:cytochrome c oxidase cbb3-type subunit III